MNKIVALLIVFTSAFAFAESREFTRYDAALHMIDQRNHNLICENDAYQDTIIEMTARAIAEDPEQLPAFIARIPKNSDILQNLLFKALLENRDLENLTDTGAWKNLLTNTRYFSRAGGVLGPALVVDLKENGRAVVTKTEWHGDKVRTRKLKATWNASVEIEPGADYYQFLEINVGKTKLLYLLKRNVQGTLLLEESTLGSDDDRSIFFFSPDDCSV